jgi:ribosomal protein S18 acetylase RimI-like enzyme
VSVRDAVRADLGRLVDLENESFAPDIRSSRGSIAHSLTSPHQRVRVACDRETQEILGASVVFRHRHTMRLYSIAVTGAARGRGIGAALVQDALELASEVGCSTLSLEVDEGRSRLVEWYVSLGFVPNARLSDYYGPGRDGLRMARAVPGSSTADGPPPG